MKIIRRITRSGYRRLQHAGRRMAIRLGYVAPRMRYPFEEILIRHKTGRANYRWGTLCSAFVAKALGYERLSVIEFGVAGGNGLLRLEAIAKDVERASGVTIDVFGFDTGEGLTEPRDYRDLPQMWKKGDYKMDATRLRSRLSKAQLILGPVAETVPAFIASSPAPVGFVSFDLDMYSSTMDALRLFRASHAATLPRVVCYFDDIIGFSQGDFNGERLAISDFNKLDELRKISKIYGLEYVLGVDKVWTEMMYMYHAFDHPRYNDFDGSNFIADIPLR